MVNPFRELVNKIEVGQLAKEKAQVEQARTMLFNSLSVITKNANIKALQAPWDKNKTTTLSLTAEQIEKVKKDIPPSTLEVLNLHKIVDIKADKGLKDIIYNFFGMDETWPLGRNLLGMFMVHSPEYPTYFIPAYSQAKATGEATDIKKGEGPRGVITGGLEGIAVGALVSGRLLKAKEMGPYVALGVGLQMISCTVFPWLGEKVGSSVYNKNLAKNAQQPPVTFGSDVKSSNANKIKLYSQINNIPKGNMKI